jgi:hypothetical protein
MSERRKGPDLLFRSLRYLALAGWLLMVVALIVLDRAKPQMVTFFDRFYGIRPRTWWDGKLAGYLPPLLWAGLGLGIIGLIANTLRHRRRNDEWRISLWLLLLVSLTGLLLYVQSF